VIWRLRFKRSPERCAASLAAERGGCARLESRLRRRHNARRRRPPRRAKPRRKDVEQQRDAEPHAEPRGPSVDPSTPRPHASAADPRLETRGSPARIGRSPPARAQARGRARAWEGQRAQPEASTLGVGSKAKRPAAEATRRFALR
jgi:hypothetical protein